ncbi:MAG: YgiT-type zinc finger protein [Microcystis aeruginosa Ma_QC_Ch_20071001_S25]|jgi:YgiT-type zinc finger domain-containing protein|uniref:YgiT-type zinc finger protein n=5 Tax=Microcystis aeruginosa TaxID=1126 RepID=I4G281_MICAE|nr:MULTISPECIES: YgiT-type zinc finger protein [Microcystis]MCA2507178.1 YgiT-type zinc finger protein [Microcystis sp. M62BS1]MCA2513483.1 YgiT-type zinc finger protein [Microcystis sp. M60BS1]MCA2517241.1 YgiT-type zinc finger protein [Microcystis sp. M59BS1]MCA2522143.1 YgiT-type zinc finger protein [Microcystis sp. M63BS1]MCA2524197.1 YgiT-type zinc finger protein [Microcystis sp. M61BS1]MCA2532758.1 YgiT-type zinc finger protein [Microcystis sp. M51BS1]MCA2536168.1 YgiT-type zinc finger
MNPIQIYGLILNQGEHQMSTNSRQEILIEQEVTYTLEINGNFFIIENVPARVCVETGERFFAPETVERLQEIIWENKRPKRVIETPVFDFAS